MKRLIACCVIALNLIVLSCTKEDVEPTPDNVSISVTQEIFELTNLHRRSIGKEELSRSYKADKIAEEHTYYMIQEQQISHDNFSKRSQNLREQVNAKTVGENVAFGYRNGKTVMGGWLNSSGHKANIEGDFTHIGIAAIKDENDNYYYTQLFYR